MRDYTDVVGRKKVRRRKWGNFVIVENKWTGMCVKPRAWHSAGFDLQYIGPKPTNVAEAWKITLQKWFIIVRCKEFTKWDVSTGGIDTCGLCLLFHVHNCHGCPIEAHTNQGACQGTPYEMYEDCDDYEKLDIYAKREFQFLLKLYRKWRTKND